MAGYTPPNLNFNPRDFTVLARDGSPVRAKFLTDTNGEYIINPNSSTGMPYVVPHDFLLARAIEVGQNTSTHLGLYSIVSRGGEFDLQRSYNGIVSGSFVDAFTDGASFVYAVIGRAGGFTETALLAGGGIHNRFGGGPDQSGIYWNAKPNVIAIRDAFDQIRQGRIDTHPTEAGTIPVPIHCFVADTPILMADGTEKPIQNIEAGDMVMSFDPEANDGLGAHVPQEVTRTFRNTTRVLIDLHGLKVTPGHEFLSDRGEWMNIANILRRDRAYVLDENGVGVPYRARTNKPLKSLGDAVFSTRFIDPRTGAERRAEVRGAIHFDYIRLTEGGVISRRPGSLVEMLHLSKRLSVQIFARDGGLCDIEGDLRPISPPV